MARHLLRRQSTNAALERFLDRLAEVDAATDASDDALFAHGAAAGQGPANDFLAPLDEDVYLFSTLLLEAILEHNSFAGGKEPGTSPRCDGR